MRLSGYVELFKAINSARERSRNLCIISDLYSLTVGKDTPSASTSSLFPYPFAINSNTWSADPYEKIKGNSRSLGLCVKYNLVKNK